MDIDAIFQRGFTAGVKFKETETAAIQFKNKEIAALKAENAALAAKTRDLETANERLREALESIVECEGCNTERMREIADDALNQPPQQEQGQG